MVLDLQAEQRVRLGDHAMGVHVDRLHAAATDHDLAPPTLHPRFTTPLA
jgi:hypothetical protein